MSVDPRAGPLPRRLRSAPRCAVLPRSRPGPRSSSSCRTRPREGAGSGRVRRTGGPQARRRSDPGNRSPGRVGPGAGGLHERVGPRPHERNPDREPHQRAATTGAPDPRIRRRRRCRGGRPFGHGVPIRGRGVLRPVRVRVRSVRGVRPRARVRAGEEAGVPRVGRRLRRSRRLVGSPWRGCARANPIGRASACS